MFLVQYINIVTHMLYKIPCADAAHMCAASPCTKYAYIYHHTSLLEMSIFILSLYFRTEMCTGVLIAFGEVCIFIFSSFSEFPNKDYYYFKEK